MPEWLHRDTKARIRSRASADLPEPVRDYIEYPDYKAVTKEDGALYSDIYWLIDGNDINLMPEDDRDKLDVENEKARKDRMALQVNTEEGADAITDVNIDIFNAIMSGRIDAITKAEYTAMLRARLG